MPFLPPNQQHQNTEVAVFSANKDETCGTDEVLVNNKFLCKRAKVKGALLLKGAQAGCSFSFFIPFNVLVGVPQSLINIFLELTPQIPWTV